MNASKDHGILAIATNEYSLLVYRAVTGGCAVLMTWWMLDLKTEVRDIRKEFNLSLIQSESRISKVEGSVNVMDSSIRMQMNALQTHENTLQNHNNRLYELNARIPRDTKP